jgi:hypothetical protein
MIIMCRGSGKEEGTGRRLHNNGISATERNSMKSGRIGIAVGSGHQLRGCTLMVVPDRICSGYIGKKLKSRTGAVFEEKKKEKTRVW